MSYHFSQEQFVRIDLLGGGEALIHACHIREIATVTVMAGIGNAGPRATRVTAIISGTLREYTAINDSAFVREAHRIALEAMQEPIGA